MLRLVMREVRILAGVGLFVAAPTTLALGKVVESRLFEMKASDPIVIGGARALARRATRIDPVQALRWE